MSNFSTVEYMNMWDMFDLIKENEYKVNMIYKNNYIELIFEDVNILLTKVNGVEAMFVEDNTPAENMRLGIYITYESLEIDKENSTDNTIYLNYNENISFEIVRGNWRECIFTSLESYENNISIHKNKNKLLDAVSDLKIDAKNDSPIHTKIFKRENNLLRAGTFEFEEGKRKVFYDPRYGFIAEGCYCRYSGIIKEELKNRKIYFEGREELGIFLNGEIFMDEPEEIVSYSVIKENIKSDLWDSEIRDSQEFEYKLEKQKNINGITNVDNLYILEFEEDTVGLGEILFEDSSVTEAYNLNPVNIDCEFKPINIDVEGFTSIEDDYDEIPF